MADGTLHVISLFSGSRGNCTLIDTGRTRILIDAGGSAKAGEDSITAARRELFEELGVSSAPENFHFLGRQRRNHAFRDLWQLTISCCTELKLQPEEVDSAAWKSRCEIMDMVERGEFINYGTEYFDMVFSGQEDERDDCCR